MCIRQHDVDNEIENKSKYKKEKKKKKRNQANMNLFMILKFHTFIYFDNVNYEII